MDSWVRIQKKNVGVVILSLFVLLFSSSFVYGQWESINPPSVSSDWQLEGVHFTSGTEGWAIGYEWTNSKGVLLHHSWGAWTPVPPPSVSSKWYLYRVHFTSASNGWAVGYDDTNDRGVLLHYSKGKWISVIPPYVSQGWYLYGVHFTSAAEGWAVGYDAYSAQGVLLHYSRGKWTSVPPPSVSSNWWSLYGVHFTSATEGWAVGRDNSNNRGVLLHYSGSTWTSVSLPSVSLNWGLLGVHFISATDGWAVGFDNQHSKGVLLLYYSIGGAGHWDLIDPSAVDIASSNWALNAVHFNRDWVAWGVGYDMQNTRGVLLYNENYEWFEYPPPSVSANWNLRGVHFTSPTEGWAVGHDYANRRGVLLHYSYWPGNSNSKLNIKGWASDSSVLSETCHIKPGGTFLLHESAEFGGPYSYTGTYSITPGGKSILFTLDSNGLLAMKAMLTDWVEEMGREKGVAVQNISFVFNKVSISKGKIQKKTNAPSKMTIKITGTLSALFDGASKTMNFSYVSSLKYYSP